jgi:hypothetical protein
MARGGPFVEECVTCNRRCKVLYPNAVTKLNFKNCTKIR